MIRTLGDMLETLRKAEAERLDAEAIRHGPTIGSMYEGLTKDILERALPPELDLRVVTGFAVDGTGGRSGQLDCMLVRGEGRPVPYVPDLFEWQVQDIIAVFEVKKTLFGGELGDAYDQLKAVGQVSSAWQQSAPEGLVLDLNPSLGVYAQCTGEVAPPSAEWRTMDGARHLVLNTIITDQIAPLRIMLGYFGYSTENGLRKGFAKLLEDNLSVFGYGPASLPNLIIANGVSLVKLTGHPWNTVLLKDGYWPILGSSHVNPTLLILEAIWTRISYSHPISELFGEDLELEAISPFICAKPVFARDGADRDGWMYREVSISAKELASVPDFAEWEPVFLDREQNAVIANLMADDVDMTDPVLLSFLAAAGREPEAFFQSLFDTFLVARDGNRLVPTTRLCKIYVLPDGRVAAADDNTGRLTRWIGRYLERRRNGVDQC